VSHSLRALAEAVGLSLYFKRAFMATSQADSIHLRRFDQVTLILFTYGQTQGERRLPDHSDW
jgi:hypothetical protein